MAKKIYEVRGTAVIDVFKRVKANDEDEAMELADKYFGGITGYCGNFGHDKLIGVDSDSESVDFNGYVEWQDAEETDDDRYDTETEGGFTYRCKLCGEEFHYDNEDEMYCNGGDDQLEHLELEHEEEYEECKDWDTWRMLKEYFEREEN